MGEAIATVVTQDHDDLWGAWSEGQATSHNVIRHMRDVGFPCSLTARWSHREAQAVSTRGDQATFKEHEAGASTENRDLCSYECRETIVISRPAVFLSGDLLTTPDERRCNCKMHSPLLGQYLRNLPVHLPAIVNRARIVDSAPGLAHVVTRMRRTRRHRGSGQAWTLPLSAGIRDQIYNYTTRLGLSLDLMAHWRA